MDELHFYRGEKPGPADVRSELPLFIDRQTNYHARPWLRVLPNGVFIRMYSAAKRQNGRRYTPSHLKLRWFMALKRQQSIEVTTRHLTFCNPTDGS